MKQKLIPLIASILMVLLMANLAAAECLTVSSCGTSSPAQDIPDGVSKVPTCPLISYEEQRQLVQSWPQTGSLTPSSSTAQNASGSAASSSSASACDTGYSPANTCAARPAAVVCDTKPTAPQGPAEPSQPESPQTPETPETPAEPEQPSESEGHYTPGSLTSQEQSLYEAVNGERVRQGLDPLPVDLELSAIAREKSQDMIENNYFAHESPTYGSAADMLDDAGYEYTSVGENIARSASVEKAHAALMSSQNHRRNILGSQWKRIGIGIVNDANGYPYITQLFVR